MTPPVLVKMEATSFGRTGADRYKHKDENDPSHQDANAITKRSFHVFCASVFCSRAQPMQVIDRGVSIVSIRRVYASLRRFGTGPSAGELSALFAVI
jgi:hypothetical protein